MCVKSCAASSSVDRLSVGGNGSKDAPPSTVPAGDLIPVASGAPNNATTKGAVACLKGGRQACPWRPTAFEDKLREWALRPTGCPSYFDLPFYILFQAGPTCH